MTSPNQILVSLLVARTTTNALAESMRLPALVIKAMADRHAKDGLVTASPLSDLESVETWTLTPAGREAALALKPAPAATCS